MNFYLEITLNPSPEIPVNFLWEKVYPQVHLALVEVKDSRGKVDIGLAFPEYDAKNFHLGSKLRLFSMDKRDLEKLNMFKWLSRLADYIHLSSIQDVPASVHGYACFTRVQPKSSNKRLARRKAKREDISFEKALSFFNKRKIEVSRVPFIHIKSLSSGSQYRLMIDNISVKDICTGKFSTYGLSSTSTVPIF